MPMTPFRGLHAVITPPPFRVWDLLKMCLSLQVLRYSLSMILALMAAGLTAARLLGSK